MARYKSKLFKSIQVPVANNTFNEQPLQSAWSPCIIVPSRSTHDGMLSLTRVTSAVGVYPNRKG